MAPAEMALPDTFSCPRCGAPCEVTRAGDLWVAACPAGDPRYVLTVQPPGAPPAEAGEDPLLGQTLGPCRLMARAGFEGGLPIYQGLGTKDSRPSVVRVLSGAAAKDRAQAEAFVRAAKLAAAVRHAAFAGVTHLARFEGGLFSVAPPLKGTPFERAGRLPLTEVLRVTRRLAEGLAALHRREIIHRNIGPHSVFLLPTGEPLLRNFAFALGPGAPAGPTEVAGQPGFLAPEQIAGGKLDGRADLYALGALLYFALAGRPPFSGASPAEVIRAQLAGPGEARQALGADAPSGLVDLVMSLLAPEPSERPAHATAVVNVLARLAGQSGDTGELALAELPPRPAAERLPMREAPPEEEEFALAPEEPVGERERPRPLPSLEIGPRPSAAPEPDEATKPRPSPRAGRPERAQERPAAKAEGAGPTLQGPEAAPTPAPRAGRPAPVEEELVLEAKDPGDGGPIGVDIPIPESKPRSSLLTPRNLLLLGGVAAVALIAFLAIPLISPSSEPETKPAEDKAKRPARAARKALSDAEKAAAEAANELARIEALAKKGPKEAEEVIKQCDAFLQRFGTSESAEAAKKLRDTAGAALREKEAKAALAAMQPGLNDRKIAYAQRIGDLDAFLKKYQEHPKAEPVAQAHKQRERLIRERDTTAEKADTAAKKELEKHLKAEAYGPAIALLTSLAETYEGTKVAAAAAAQAAELRGKLTAEFKEKRAAADECLRRAAFGEAVALLDAPLNVWQFDELRREAADFVASVQQRRATIVKAYSALLAETDALAEAWKLDEARAAATEAAGKADDPVRRALLEAKGAEMAALLRARDRIVAGANKVAQGKSKVTLRRATGMGLPTTISNPSSTGLDADMPGFKGHLGWGDLHADQLLLFARSAPDKATAADLVAIGLVALRAGEVDAAFKAFNEATDLDPGTLDAVGGLLRRHAQGFVLVPGGQFPAGPKKEPANLEPFLLARAEVTNAEFAFFARVTKAELPSDWKVGTDEHPVANITWAQANAYARWLDMRLPTDLEWERAARGTEGRLYPWGNQFDPARANLGKASGKGPVTPSDLMPAYRQPRRAEGPFFHLVGNVREWTASLTLDPKGHPTACRVVGASAADPEKEAAATARQMRKLDARDPYTGFRLAWPR
ncbi:MAG: hypothetical protein FJ290_29085 [Planctomycetes bacterium]|nr:hypothetical protein [Planctomycetota bacterium]